MARIKSSLDQRFFLMLEFEDAGVDLSRAPVSLGGGQRIGLLVLPQGTIAREAELNGVEEVLITERLRQELDGSVLPACTDIGMSPCPVMKIIGSSLFAAARSR
jgi:hypothetical protein